MTTTTAFIQTLADEAETVDTTQPRFPITWAREVYEQCDPLSFLVDGLITKGSVNLLVGEGGAKKTWAALDLAVCVATGNNWLDFPTEQAPVLIVDEESGPRRLRRRLYEVLGGHLIQRDENPPVGFVSLNQMDLGSQDADELHNLILQTGAGLVILDALADVMPGADENSVKDVQPIFMKLRDIAEKTKAAILVVHHANKANGGYRGSTAIKGAVDLMLMVDSQPESKFIEFSADKTRDIEHVKFTALATWVAEPPQFYLTVSEADKQIHLNKGQRYVMRFLSEHGNSPMDDILGHVDNCSEPTAKTAVYSLTDKKWVHRTDEGGRGSRAFYDLTDEGRQIAEAAL